MNRSLSDVMLRASLAGVVSWGAASSLAAPGQIASLGTVPGGNYSGGSAISGTGLVAGSAHYDVNGHQHAFRWSPGTGIEDLGTLGGTFSYGYGVNDAGQVVGQAYNASNQGRAVLWNVGSPIQDLGTLGGTTSEAHAINDSGQVTGMARTADGYSRAFRWTAGGGMQNLGALGGSISYSYGYAISPNGQVTGYTGPAGQPAHAFIWTEGVGMRDLGAFAGNKSQGRAINNSGQVAGFSEYSSGGYAHAFRWSEQDGMRDLGALGGPNSQGLAINAAGVVVGWADPSTGTALASLWKVDGSIVDLDGWLDAANPAQGANWQLLSADGITDAGLITGMGSYNDGAGGLPDGFRAFVLDASSLVPEPGVLGAVVGGALLALSRRARRKLTRPA